jgi:hypothetical protein
MHDAGPVAQPQWNRRLEELLPLFGHRNWLVVADAAYPAQSGAGIETIVADAHHGQVISTVLSAIALARHVRANVYVDSELAFMDDERSPGIGIFRTELEGVLQGLPICRLPHEQIIAKVDHCAQTFRVLIIKTEMLLAYSTVFFELDCGYWNADAEQGLRETIREAGKQAHANAQ